MKWSKKAGLRPNQQLLRVAGKYVRHGTGDHLVVAMAMRPTGVTQGEVISVLGKPHRNVIRTLVSSSKVGLLTLPSDGRQTRIRLVKK